jgi:primosomal protein N'
VAIPPYGVAIQEAVASGDLSKMKEAAQQAEQYVREWGDVSSALEVLKLEISKMEKKPYGRT